MDVSTILFEEVKTKFSPKKLSGLVIWLRSDLGITIGTGVSTWADQSGNGNDVTQATGSKQPAYTASSAVFNNKPCLRGDGVDDVLANTGTVWPTSTLTVFAVLASVSGGTTGEWFSDAQGGGNAPLHFYGAAETQWKRHSTGPELTLTSATKTIITYSVTGSGAGSIEKAYKNGGGTVTVNDAALAIVDRKLFIFDANTATIFPRKYDLAEFMIYNRVLSASEQRKVERYLGKRYAITLA